MNQLFYFPRWWMLVTRHWAENQRRYLLSLLAIAGLLTAWCGFIAMMDKTAPIRIDHQMVTYFFGLTFTGCIHASMIFASLGNKKEATQYLSVPASQFEKLLCALFYGVFLFFVFFTLVFYLVDIPMVAIIKQMALSDTRHNWQGIEGNVRYGICNIFSNEGAFGHDVSEPIFLLAYFALQSAFILGSVYFPRYAFIKTVIAVLVLILICILFVGKIMEGLLPQGWMYSNLLAWRHYAPSWHSFEEIDSAPWIEYTLRYLLEFSLPFIFWYITYIRLKEKEV